MKKRYIFWLVFIISLFETQAANTVKADSSGYSENTTVNAQNNNTNDKNKSDNKNNDNASANDGKTVDANNDPNKQKNDSESPKKEQNKQSPQVRPKIKQGWVKKGKKQYFYKNNKKVKGLVKIKKYHYLFNKHGVLLSGLRKTPHKSTYSYYMTNGKRSEKSVSTKKAYYWIKKGVVKGIKNYAKCICQRPELPTGCEMTAATMMINFAGKKVSKLKIANETPRSSNPNKGFIGSPYKAYPAGYWVAPGGLKGVVKKYLGKAKIMTSCGLSAIKNKLLHSHLVVVWVNGMDGFSNHALTLTGYHNQQLYYNDPWTGAKAQINSTTFTSYWSCDGYRALSY